MSSYSKLFNFKKEISVYINKIELNEYNSKCLRMFGTNLYLYKNNRINMRKILSI